MDHPGIDLRTSGLSGRPVTSSRVRVSRWRGEKYVAQVSPSRSTRRTETLDVVHCLERLHERGVTRAVTPALSSWDAQPFIAAGFGLHEYLHLLCRPLEIPFDEPNHKSRPAAPWHRAAALAVDAASFEPFWRFDLAALNEARRATPQHRFRVILADRKVIAYAIHGRAGSRGYLQRLAVMPGFEGSGLGTSLVNDGLAWLRQKGATEVLVNTQEHNSRALGLYKHMGFALQAEKLSVLTWTP